LGDDQRSPADALGTKKKAWMAGDDHGRREGRLKKKVKGEDVIRTGGKVGGGGEVRKRRKDLKSRARAEFLGGGWGWKYAEKGDKEEKKSLRFFRGREVLPPKGEHAGKKRVNRRGAIILNQFAAVWKNLGDFGGPFGGKGDFWKSMPLKASRRRGEITKKPSKETPS